VWPWARGAPEIWGFSFNISATAEASDFKSGKQFGFAKFRHKNQTQKKNGGGLGLEQLPKILVFPIIFPQRPWLATLNLV